MDACKLATNVILGAASRVLMLPGDLHTEMHMLEAIFDLFYGHFLQVFQAVVEYRNIKKDPKDRLQKSADFVDLVSTQLQRELYFDWVRTNSKAFTNPVTAARAFLAFCEERSSCSDDVVKFSSTFMDMYKIYSRFSRAVRVGDSVAIEAGYLDFLPYFNYCTKHHYVELVFRQADDLYVPYDPCATAFDTLQPRSSLQ